MCALPSAYTCRPFFLLDLKFPLFILRYAWISASPYSLQRDNRVLTSRPKHKPPGRSTSTYQYRFRKRCGICSLVSLSWIPFSAAKMAILHSILPAQCAALFWEGVCVFFPSWGGLGIGVWLEYCYCIYEGGLRMGGSLTACLYITHKV